ncbi:hypothetical protein [Sinorhizobium sp. NFACC03]|uniref:hypothetical protein n=1 Tax=Sinorhizobium sp. NFACC03 TaxID=1566295 RepID=UPI00088E6E97|nr:hypothetical protein [Sinorhizobium sp. NFACC03]SDA39484.1 hypothetical protein SAMN03159448_00192 [Sinorhizobium sp. NFACC03]
MAIFSLITTGLGALFGSTIIGNLVGGALAFGAKLGLTKLGQTQQKKQKFTAVQGELQIGGDVPVGALLGTGKTRGQRLFYAKWGKGNKMNADVFALANGWCDGLEPYMFMFGEKYNLVPMALAGGEAARYGVEGFIDGDGNSSIDIRFYDGRPDQVHDAELAASTAALGNTWKATSRLRGVCYVVVYRYYHLKFFRDAGRGRPDIEWMLRGLREYDPTKDSTVAGGNGPQRLNDPSTHVHTLNPAIHRLNYQLGLRGLLSGRTLIGEGKSLGQLDLSSYFVAINYCRTLRKGKPIYQCSLWVNSETDHTEALSAFDDAMAGYGLNRRGLSGVVVGAPQIPVLTIMDADIPSDRPKPRQPRKSAFDLFNHLSGQFTSPDSMWNPESLKPIVVNADVSADKRPRQTSIDFLQVHDADIAQYLLNIRYRQNRKGGTVTLPVSRRVGLKVMEGEWVTYQGKDWMVSEWRCDADLRFTFVLTETGADIYDDGDIAPGPVIIPPVPPVNPSQLSVIQNFGVATGVIAGASGSQVPCLRFTWTPPEDPTIVSVNITYQVVGDTQTFSDVSNAPESGLKLTTDNVVSGKAYRAKATITTNPDRFRTETPWVTTAAPTGNLSVLDNSITASKIADAAVTADKIMNEAITSLKLAAEAVTTAKIQVGAIDALRLADNSVVANKIANAAVTGAKIADAAITGTKIVDLAITETKIANDAISTPKLQANAITATALAADSVTARSLVLTDFSNIVDNGWQTGTLDGWTTSFLQGFVLDTGAGDASGWRIHSVGRDQAFSNHIACTPGEQYYVEAWVYNTDASSANLYMFTWDAAGTGGFAANPVATTNVKNQWIKLQGIATVPAGKGRIALCLQTDRVAGTGTYTLWSKPVMRRASAAELIVDGAVYAKHMSVGSGKNMLPNTENYGGTQDWSYWNQGGIANRQASTRLEGDTWALTGQPMTVVLEQHDGNPANEVQQWSCDRRVPVKAGSRYEAYAFLGSHRCQHLVAIAFYDSNGAGISEASTGWINAQVQGGNGKPLSNYTQSGLFAIAPANAATALFYVRKSPTLPGQVNSFMHMVRPYLGEAYPNQAQFSPWEPGGITTIGADYIRTGAVIAGKIAASAVTAGAIAAGAVTAEKIAASAVTADKIAANSVTASHIVANSISASKLVLTDFSNIADNGWQRGTLEAWWTSYMQAFYFNPNEDGGNAAGYVLQSLGRECAISQRIACSPGEAYFFDVWVNNSDVGSANILAMITDGNGGNTAWLFAASTNLKNQWVRLQGRVTVPTGRTYIQMMLMTDRTGGTGTSTYWSKPVMRRAAGAELIVDGAITANKLSVNSLSAISANFGDAYFSGIARSVNGKLLLDFNNGGIEVFT